MAGLCLHILYEQGKMEHLIPEGEQNRILENIPFTEWKNPYIDASARETDRAETEVQEEKQTVVTLAVAEYGEYSNLGEYHENITSVEEAVAVFKQIPLERMNAIPSIIINIHTEGTEPYEDANMLIVFGETIDLESLEYYPKVAGDKKALEFISELIENLPEMDVYGSLEQWLSVDTQRIETEPDKIALLAAEIDQLSYNFDTYQYNHTVEDREAQIANITEDIRNGNIGYLNDFLNALISDSIREGMTDIFGKGTELDDREGVQTARKAK